MFTMKKRLFFDMDNVLVDFQSGLDKIDEETKQQYRAKGPGDKTVWMRYRDYSA